jgi:hypothetical protein
MKTEHLIFVSKKNDQDVEESQTGTHICKNTDGILDPLEQMRYALNGTQVKYGPIVVLNNAP